MHAGLNFNIQTDPFKSTRRTENMFPPYGNDDVREEKPLHFDMPSSSVRQEQLPPAQDAMFDPDMMMQPTFPTMEGLAMWDSTTVQSVQESVMTINTTQTTLHEGPFLMGEGSGSGSGFNQFQFNGVANYVEPMTASTLGIGGRGMGPYGPYPPYLFQAMMSGDAFQANANFYNPAAEIERANATERRFRRMIKNRESAARSRARRLAYDTQLEYENRKLRKENEILRRMIKDLSNIVASDKVKKGMERSLSGPF